MAKAVTMLMAVALVVAVMSASGASVDICDPGQLSECLPALIRGSTPTPSCCSILGDCFCQNAQNPAYAKYTSGDNARHALTACNIPNC